MKWKTEKERDVWTDKDTGYQICIQRHTSLKHLCGYVGLPVGHPWHGKNYDSVSMLNNDYVEVHGGLTYADSHSPNAEPDGLWWLGFDCAHAGDFCPGMSRQYVSDDIYRDWSYVTHECESLARQAKQTAVGFECAP